MSDAPSPASQPGPDEASPKARSNLTQRLLTAGVLAPVIVALLFWEQKGGFLAVIYAAAFLCSRELGSMVAPDSTRERAWLIVGSLLLLTCVFVGVHVRPSPECVVGGAAFVVFAGFTLVLLRPEAVEGADRAMAWSVAGPFYIGGLLGTIALLHQFPNGGGWVLLSMLFAFLSDTGAYFAGRGFGRRKLYPKVSPKKTVEGSFGGLFGASFGALLAHFWFLPELSLAHAIPLALVAGAIGQMGDLYASLIKRSSGAKDSGSVLPGHGGMLDRIDALLVTAAVTWAYRLWVWHA